jgi:Mlc titration factor MtfA (ptsG expression regulator)
LPILIVLGLILLAALGWAARRYWRRRRREILFQQPLPEDRRGILERIPLYRRLPGTLRPVLHGLVNIFLDEKRFVGCNGLEITDEMRVAGAGEAPFPGISDHPRVSRSVRGGPYHLRRRDRDS